MADVRNDFEITGSTAKGIRESIESGVEGGYLAPGSLLPPVRKLAATLGASPTTVAAAYRQLQGRGVVNARERGRTRITYEPSNLPNLPLRFPAGVHDLATGNPDAALLPQLQTFVSRSQIRTRLYGGEANLPELLDLAAKDFESDGVPSDNLAVVSGALDGIERVFEVHLRRGDIIAVEDPGYAAVLNLCRGMGLIPHAVSIDDFGPLPEALAQAIAAGAKSVIITPRSQNPLGSALNRARVKELESVLAEVPDLLVIEDDHAGMIAGIDYHPLVSGRKSWACIRSMTKALGPDLRLALVAGDSDTISKLNARQRLGCGWVSNVLQGLVIDMATDPNVEALMMRASQTYNRRREAAIEELAELGIRAHGRSGLHMWVPVPEESTVISGLLQRGWAVRGGERFRINSVPAIRVTTAVLTDELRTKFVRDLATVLQRPDLTNLA